MIVKDLLERLEYEHVQDAILKLYPQEHKRIFEGFYRFLFQELRNIGEVENLNHMTLHVQYVKEHEMVDHYIWNVSYTVDRRLHHQYGLQFATREQIVSAFVEDRDLETQASEEYLAHILCDIAREGQMDEQEDGIRSVEPKNHLPHFSDSL